MACFYREFDFAFLPIHDGGIPTLVDEPDGDGRRAMQLHGQQSATKAIADCYLVGFAESAGARLVTFDRGLAATAKLRMVLVSLLAPGVD